MQKMDEEDQKWAEKSSSLEDDLFDDDTKSENEISNHGMYAVFKNKTSKIQLEEQKVDARVSSFKKHMEQEDEKFFVNSKGDVIH